MHSYYMSLILLATAGRVLYGTSPKSWPNKKRLRFLQNLPNSFFFSHKNIRTEARSPKPEARSPKPTSNFNINHAIPICKMRSLAALLFVFVAVAVVDGHGYMTSPRR